MAELETCEDIEEKLKKVSRRRNFDLDEFREVVAELMECRQKEEIRDYVDIAVIIPKTDNSGVPFRKDVLEGYQQEVADKFGGITVYPDIRGCFYSPEKRKLQCEENMLMTATIKKRELPGIKLWLDDFKSKVAHELGQEALYVTSEQKGVERVPGKRRERVPERTVEED